MKSLKTAGAVSTYGVPSTMMATRPSISAAATASGFPELSIVGKMVYLSVLISCSIYPLSSIPS
jgi:hypothetical protein